jgi:hypothetical protein
MLVRLVYVSRSVNPLDEASTESILASAKANNAAHGITGILCHGGGIYLQALEGGRQAVNALYTHLIRDARHADVVLLHYEEIKERRYSGWSMGQVNLAKLNASLVLKYSETSQLDPYAVSGDISLILLEELMATAAIMGRS